MANKFEAKHIFYIPSAANDTDDAFVIKETVHAEDGTLHPNLRVVRNMQRDFYVTKELHRKHPCKKESEDLIKLKKVTCNNREMLRRIGFSLRSAPARSLKMAARSPYLYGSDVCPETLVKHKYATAFPDLMSLSSVCVLDIETDMFGAKDSSGFGDIVSISLTMKNRAFLCYTRKFINDNDADGKLQALFTKYLGKHQTARGIELETLMVEDEMEAIAETMKRAHQWKPDYLSVWNLNFDLPKMLRVCHKYGVDPATIFSDPTIPADLRYADYVEGPAKRVKADGKTMSFPIQDRWHTFTAPAHFYWVCSMCTYNFIRKAKGMLKEYNLDYILNLELGERKLNFTFADGKTKAEWHIFMQANYKLEYLIYNLFDCIGVELLDEKTNDLSTTLGGLIGQSPLRIFSSTPKQLADDLHFFFLEKFNKVICSTSDQMATELDEKIIGVDDWIITLATHLVEDNGLKAVKDMDDLRTLIRAYVWDLDIRSAYPWGEIVSNSSKGTTALELCRIQGVSEAARRQAGLNLTGGPTNAVQWCQLMHNLPPLQSWNEAYRKSKEMAKKEAA